MSSFTVKLPPTTPVGETTRVSTADAPVTPTGLIALGGSGQITVYWDYQFELLGWELYRSTSSPVTTSDTKIEIAASESNYTDTGLSNGTTYYYALRTKSSAGFSSLSSEVSAKPTAWANTSSIQLTRSTNDNYSLASTELDYDFTADDFSVAAWVKMDSFGGGGNRAIISNHTGSTGWFLRSNSSGVLVFRLETDASNYIVANTSGTSIAAGTWYHVVATYVSSTETMSIYINGTSAGGATSVVGTTGTVDYSSLTPKIGAQGSAGFNWDGNISDLGLYSSALGAASVTALYNTGTPIALNSQPSATTLTNWWLMGDGTGDSASTIVDQLGEADGTAVNSPALEADVP